MAKRGEVLRDIADEFGGVAVSFPRSGTNSDRVVLKGAKDCVEGMVKLFIDCKHGLSVLSFVINCPKVDT